MISNFLWSFHTQTSSSNYDACFDAACQNVWSSAAWSYFYNFTIAKKVEEVEENPFSKQDDKLSAAGLKMIITENNMKNIESKLK